METADEDPWPDEKNITAKWIDEYRPMYERAMHHPFILSIRDGTVDIAAFKRWLVYDPSSRLDVSCSVKPFVPRVVRGLMDQRVAGQDYIFVREFVPFIANVLLKACAQSDCPSDMEVILGGIASLNDEISWFKKESSKWDVDLHSIVPRQANVEYCRFLRSLTGPEVSYTTAITAFWVIETVYQESFALCLENGSNTPAELMETCQRWGNAGFGEYCRSLQAIADRCLEKASSVEIGKVERIFGSVLLHETTFWDMSSGSS